MKFKLMRNVNSKRNYSKSEWLEMINNGELVNAKGGNEMAKRYGNNEVITNMWCLV